jgi:hypothetical protein
MALVLALPIGIARAPLALPALIGIEHHTLALGDCDWHCQAITQHTLRGPSRAKSPALTE